MRDHLKRHRSRDSGFCDVRTVILCVLGVLCLGFVLEFFVWMRMAPPMPSHPHGMNLILTNPAESKIEEAEVVAQEDIQGDVPVAVAHVKHAGGPAHPTSVSKVTFYQKKNCEGEVFLVVYSNSTENNCENCFDLCGKMFPGTKVDIHRSLGSVKVEGDHEMNIYGQCAGQYTYENPDYQSTIFSFDGCVNTWHSHQITHVKFAPDSTMEVQPQALIGHGDYRVVYSGESSKYMGYQARCNYWGFLKSGQTNGAHSRLVTMHEPDDITQYIPSFWAKRHPFSRRYGPFNKPDVLEKWFRGPNAPKEEVVVLIDPDNFLTKDISPIIKEVKKGHAIAQAAWFAGSKLVMELYKDMCTVCNDFVDYVAVPVFIHKDDLKPIATLWKKFVIAIKDRVDNEPGFKQRYSGIQIDWGGEMHAYIFAASELGIRHETRRGLQIRDVDAPPDANRAASTYMLHMGRAWFPKDYLPGKKFWHTEGRAWSYRGQQVWCKCNVTAADVMPWPLPDHGLDWQSNITLTYLHDSAELFELVDSKFRPSNYHLSYP